MSSFETAIVAQNQAKKDRVQKSLEEGKRKLVEYRLSKDELRQQDYKQRLLEQQEIIQGRALKIRKLEEQES